MTHMGMGTHVYDSVEACHVEAAHQPQALQALRAARRVDALLHDCGVSEQSSSAMMDQAGVRVVSTYGMAQVGRRVCGWINLVCVVSVFGMMQMGRASSY
eukprot:TRINITY_DN3234_c0_g1_i1.p2 TRINITY_DN3234_c0_g1~~TRINITY_DN3234_c0_g1_i1.p2  ORF type:complete len:100 (+),score=1.11 TRINITY_DN3234_c0_g1_i1:255-554(+)